MQNEIRGEATIKTSDGKEITLCLSLGAMAMLQTELGIEDFSKIGESLKKPNAEVIGKVVLCLAHGGGHEEFKLEDVMKLRAGLPVLMAGIKKAMSMGETDENGAPLEIVPAGN
jgi:hypothetical protein